MRGSLFSILSVAIVLLVLVNRVWADFASCLAIGLEHSEFWSRPEPIYLSESGTGLPLTFSIDTEISYELVIDTLARDPVGLAGLQASLPKLPISALCEHLKVSERQLRAFGLRKGVTRDLQEYTLADLNFGYLSKTKGEFGRLDLFFLGGGIEPWRKVEKLNKAYLEKHGLSLDRSASDGFLPEEKAIYLIEVTTASSHNVPRELRRESRGLYNSYSSSHAEPQTHFHIGLPSQAISKEQAIAIASAIETRIVIDLAGDGSSDPLKFTSSPLTRDFERGVVKLNLDRFQSPVPAHDLEIRQYFSMEQAEDLIAFGAKLAESHGQLPRKTKLYGSNNYDAATGNLKGAFERGAEALANLPPPDGTRLSKALQSFAQRIGENQNSISPGFRKEVQKFLLENHVGDRLRDPRLFLAP